MHNHQVGQFDRKEGEAQDREVDEVKEPLELHVWMYVVW
jgi:hypothetical protein